MKRNDMYVIGLDYGSDSVRAISVDTTSSIPCLVGENLMPLSLRCLLMPKTLTLYADRKRYGKFTV